jgi:hypothetical protein
MSSQRSRFEADFVVDRISESLLAAQVAFCRLDAHMTEQKLNLLKLPASFMTQAGACAAQIVGGQYFPDHISYIPPSPRPRSP